MSPQEPQARDEIIRLWGEIGSNIFDHLDEWILEAEGVREPPPPVR